jgi:hypothetical protein
MWCPMHLNDAAELAVPRTCVLICEHCLALLCCSVGPHQGHGGLWCSTGCTTLECSIVFGADVTIVDE